MKKSMRTTEAKHQRAYIRRIVIVALSCAALLAVVLLNLYVLAR